MGASIDVILVCPPFSSVLSPPIGLGILKGALTQNGITSTVELANLSFAKKVGIEACQQLALGHPTPHDLVGEWIFSRPRTTPRGVLYRRYKAEVLQGEPPHHVSKPLDEEFLTAIAKMRRVAIPFCQDTAKSIVARRPRIVAFSSVYQQTIASAQIAHFIKEHDPEIWTVIGGANCEGEMGAEIFRLFPQFDIVVGGEGDVIFPDIVSQILADDALSSVADGVHCRTATKASSDLPHLDNLDLVPQPDYSDFLERFPSLNIPWALARIPFEASRGCWWGQKHHCIFCGLNGATMAYRRKSAEKVEKEVRSIVQTFPDSRLVAVDNILDLKLLPTLSSMATTNEIFFEAKANLRRSDLAQLKSANVTELQLGIESLSTFALNVLRKGVSALQNIQSLKWCTEFGIRVDWNMLVDIPGVAQEEYRRQARLVPLLTHLAPPISVGFVRVDRFSPLYRQSTNVRAFPSYKYVFDIDSETACRLAYFFTSDDSGRWISDDVCLELQESIASWREVTDKAILIILPKKEGGCHVFDSRQPALPKLLELSKDEQSILEGCEKIVSLGRLAASNHSTELVASRLLHRLMELGLVIEESGKYLSLIPRTSENYPGRGTLQSDQPV